MPVLQDKIILIVGGATGIGRATARLCSERGATVVVADFAADEGQKAAVECGGLFIQVNVTDESQVAALAQKLSDAYGRIDASIPRLIARSSRRTR